MKNTTFRKKALLSSVAMLLVAIVALGSATFAWFTQNPTVTASGLVMDASVTGGLQIYAGKAKDAGLLDWATTTTLNAVANEETEDTKDAVTDPKGITFGTPLSYNYSASGFFTTTAALENEYNMKEGATISGKDAADYSEQIFLRTSVAGGEDVEVDKVKVTITQSTAQNTVDKEYGANTTDLASAVRVMLVKSDNSVIGTWSIDGVANDYLTATGLAGSTYPGAYGNGVVATASDDEDLFKTPITVSADGEDYVTAYVWLDGEDSACTTNKVQNLANIVESISVEFTLAD